MAGAPAATDANVTNDLFDVFSTNAPAGGGDSGKAADPLANIFAAGDQPLAPNPASIPNNDKLSLLQGFYNNEAQTAGGPPQPN